MKIDPFANKIRVAFFGDDFSRKGKGTALVVQKIAQEIVDKFSDKIELVIIRRSGRCEHPICQKVKNIEIKRIPILGTLFSYFLFFLFNKEKFDIVMFNKFVYPGFWFLNSKKFVLLAHDAPVSPVYKEKLMFSAKFFYWFLGAAGKHFLDLVVVDSESARQEVIHYHNLAPDKVFVVYDAAGEEFRKFTDEEKKAAKEILRGKYGITAPYILDVSRLDPHKNIHTVLDAYFLLKEKYSFPHKLVIVGGFHADNYSRIIEEKVASHKFGNLVLFADYIESEDLPAVYNLGDLLVFPSLMEGFGLPLVEAMKCGMPVITSDISSLPEVIGEAGIKVDPLNAKVMAEKMVEVLNNEELRKQLSDGGLERGKDFNWKKTAEGFVKIYEYCLSS